MADTETTEKKGKDVFEGGSKNEEGKYTEAPTDFNYDTFKPLKKADFADETIYLDHQAGICTAKAEIFTANAAKCTRKAAQMREFGDPETRKKAMKLQKMREQLKALEAGLIEDGVDITLLNN